MRYLFDWNGTIADDADRACLATNAALTAVAAGLIDRESFDEKFMLPMDAMFLRLGVPAYDIGRALTEWNAFMASRPAPIRAGAVEFLDSVRALGEYCAVISAASADYVLGEVRHFGMTAYFDAILTGASDKVQALMGLRQDDEAVYFGDTEYDMACAVAAGCIPVGVASGYCPEERLRAAGARVVIRDYAELRNMDLFRRPAAL
jgi:phosphoglycolate phosphatase